MNAEIAIWSVVGLFALLFIIIGAVVVKSLKNKPGASANATISADKLSANLPQNLKLVQSSDLKQQNIDSSVGPKITDKVLATEPVTLKKALAATEKNLWGRIKELLVSSSAEQNFSDIEEVLFTSDLGPKTVEFLIESVKAQLSLAEMKNPEQVKAAFRKLFVDIFSHAHIQEPINDNPTQFLKLSDKPAVWMIVGVNGAGKTTSIGKIAAHLAGSGLKVLVAAGDTFRAAAGNQLKVWTERAQVEIFSPPGVLDPSAVAFDAIAKAKAQGYDVVLIDTAGRLHTQAHLMEELKKMKRVMSKVVDSAPQETLIILDANMGQNALLQAREFHNALGLTGVVLTKMDGTAKGGVAVGLANELQIPIRMIGVGEKIGDLRPFSTQEFVDSVL